MQQEYSCSLQDLELFVDSVVLGVAGNEVKFWKVNKEHVELSRR